MRIAALSDLHIGALARQDTFEHSEQAFLGFLDTLEAGHDCIVLVGDVFQAQHGWAVGERAAERELVRAQARVPRLWARLRREPYRYVFGNHDHVAGTRHGAHARLRLEADGFAALFIHGHQFDPLLRNIYPVTRATTWVSGRLRWAALRGLADHLEAEDIRIKHERFRGPAGPYGRAAGALLREHRADVVVMGHTHVADRVELPGGLMINTGSCSRGRRIYASIDTHARTAELRADADDPAR